MLTPDVRLRQIRTSAESDLTGFLAECRDVDKEVSEYAVRLVKERFAQVDEKTTMLDGCQTWDSFAFGLGVSVGRHLVPQQPAEWARQLFLDLYLFCERNPNGARPYRFARILYNLSSSGWIRQFLPAEAEQCYALVGEWVEADRDREGQQGY